MNPDELPTEAPRSQRRVALRDDLVIPQRPWAEISRRINDLWRARDSPHMSIIGQTGSGKSYLTRYGILPTCVWDRVLIIDGKGDDPTLEGLGRVVNRYPGRYARAQKDLFRENARGGNWFRLITSPDWDIARDQVAEALQMVYDEGDWVVVIDELRYVTDMAIPGLAQRGHWERIVLRGRSRGVAAISLTQEPSWVPGSFYTQSSFYWYSRIEDDRAQKRVAEVGTSRGILNYLPRIPKKQWIYMDNLEDERYWAITKVTRGRADDASGDNRDSRD